jgi:hypothetical protein
MLMLAEATIAYEPIADGEELVETDRYLLFLGRGDHALCNTVQRLRLTAATLGPTVEEVRAIARRHGRRAVTWEVASYAPRSNMADLVKFGMTPARPPAAVVMALREAPPPPPDGIVVTHVDTLEAFRTYVRITHEAFGTMDRLAQALDSIAKHGERDLADARFVRYLAHSETEAVAAGAATFTKLGAILHSGSTKPSARGRGAYRALVAARWRDAVARGTPFVVTRSGPMSRPILRRVGFEELGEIRFFIDELGDPP